MTDSFQQLFFRQLVVRCAEACEYMMFSRQAILVSKRKYPAAPIRFIGESLKLKENLSRHQPAMSCSVDGEKTTSNMVHEPSVCSCLGRVAAAVDWMLCLDLRRSLPSQHMGVLSRSSPGSAEITVLCVSVMFLELALLSATSPSCPITGVNLFLPVSLLIPVT